MNDWILNLGVSGQEKVVGSLQQVVKTLNDADKTEERQRRRMDQINRLAKERNHLARQARDASFQQLSHTDKLERLERKRLETQQRIEKAAGNEYRLAVLRTSLARTEAAIRRVGPGTASQAPGSGSVAGEGFLGGLLGGAAGKIGRFLPGVGAIFGLRALWNYASGFLNEADELSNLAEMNQMTRGQLIALRKGGVMSGVRETTSLRGLQAFEQARGRALGQDEDMIAALASVGIKPDQLQRSAFSLAQSVTRTTAQGYTAEQVPQLQKLFGFRWRETLAAIRAASTIPSADIARDERNLEFLHGQAMGIESFKMRMRDYQREGVAALFGGGTFRDRINGEQGQKQVEVLQSIEREMRGLRTDMTTE